MSVVVQPSARETFTARELATAYRDFTESEPQYVNSESGLKASAYRFGTRVLVAYEENESGAVLLLHPTCREGMSSRSVGSRNAARLDINARLNYFRNVRSSWLVYRVYR